VNDPVLDEEERDAVRRFQVAAEPELAGRQVEDLSLALKGRGAASEITSLLAFCPILFLTWVLA